MVNPSSRLGQRRNAISLRMSLGRLGSSKIESAAIAAAPAAAILLINFRRLVAAKANRSRAWRSRAYSAPLLIQNNLKAGVTDMQPQIQRQQLSSCGCQRSLRVSQKSAIRREFLLCFAYSLRELRGSRFLAPTQKLNVACKSMRRTAPAVEKGPPWRAFGIPKKVEPRMPLGFAVFTLLKTLRTFTPKVRL